MVTGSVRVSVVMPAYNAERHIDEAIASVLRQSHSDLELVIVDDGSNDGTAARIAGFTDPRIRLIRLSRNRGLVHALNRGIAESSGALIARFDADDVMEADRLAAQVQFLARHAEVDILGSDMTFIDPQGAPLQRTRPLARGQAAIRFALLSRCAFNHPTVIFRRDRLAPFLPLYEEGYRFEDWRAWTRLAPATCMANQPEKTVRYRVADGTLSRSVPDDLRRVEVVRILTEYYTALGLTVPSEAFLCASSYPGRYGREMSPWRYGVEARRVLAEFLARHAKDPAAAEEVRREHRAGLSRFYRRRLGADWALQRLRKAGWALLGGRPGE